MWGIEQRRAWLFRFSVLAVAAVTAAAVYGGWRYRAWRGQFADEDTFDEIIEEAVKRHQVPACLVKAVIRQESSFRPLVRGGAGEIGLMQITEGAILDWERFHGRRCPRRGMFFDPRMNIEVGTWYLARALNKWRDYRDAEVLALAEYNAGRTNALNWAPEDRRENALERIHFPGVREYIEKVMKYRLAFELEQSRREENTKQKVERIAEPASGR